MNRTTLHRKRGFEAITVAVAVLAALLLGAQPAAAQWQIKSEDGAANLKLGFLVQGRAEWQKTQEVDAVAQTMYLRRTRILLGGKVNQRVSFFLETDSPNLGRHSGAEKSYPSMYLQDFFVTWTLNPNHLIDAGLMLTPDSYNHLQSAISLLAMDYGPYTFVEASPLSANIGRDTGVQVRGLLGAKMVEYRVGLFQGRRASASDADSYRGMARLTVYPFQTGSTGYFYSGTMMGKARNLAIGGTVDFQKDYKAYHGDLFLEAPVTPGSCLTVQADLGKYDGGDYIALLEQTTWMAEAGYAVHNCQFGPFVQVSGRNYKDDSMTDLMNGQVGLFYRPDGHRENLKLGLSRASGNAPTGQSDPPKKTAVQVQYQISYF
jgi:hypothetical protein